MTSPEKLRILHIIPSLIKGGAERLTLNTCQALSQRDDAEVMLVHLREGNDYRFIATGFPVVYCPARVIPSMTGKWIRDTENLTRQLNAFRPHIIHSHLFEAEIASRDVIIEGAVYFSHLHDNMFQFRNMRINEWFNKKRLTEWYEKRWMISRYRKSNNFFIAISRDAERFFREVLPPDLHRISLLNNAIDYGRFYRPEITPLSDNLLKMVTTGSLVNKKNQQFLVSVVQELNRHGKKAELYVLGDGPNRGAISSAIKSAGLEDQIFLEGSIDLVENYLHQAQFYVHPATYEPFGLVLLEAMAAGLACVSLDGGGNRDIHREGQNGFMINRPDAAAFAAALIRLAEDPELYRNICIFSQKFAAEYDIRLYVERLMQLYRARIAKQPHFEHASSSNE